MMEIPSYWVTDLAYVSELAGTVHNAQSINLGNSAGGRPVWAFSYGEKQELAGTANYSSACGAKDKDCYAPQKDKKPVVILLGAVHGAEIEGTAALVNLIHLLEDGKDLRGEENTALKKAADGIRLVIVPVCNPDGRARFPFAAPEGMTMEEQRYWFQGTWKDGSLCGWPGCKKIHPIKEKCDFLGCYFNDDGVNIMHDNFFRPMARETQYLMDLADAEKADYIIHLHGGSNANNALCQPNYVTQEVQERVFELAVRCDAEAGKEGLSFEIISLPPRERGAVPPSFNLVSALHHVCGAVSAVFESNQQVAQYPGPKLTFDEIYRSHMILFEQLFTLSKIR